jgi:hypothetical protein
LFGGFEPELHAIEELEARQIDDRRTLWLSFCAEEDGGREDPLKTLNHATIVRAILGEPEEIEELGGALEVNDSTLRLDGECRDPNRDQAVLAVGEAVSRVGRDFEEEAPVVASVGQLFLRRAAKRDPAEHKRPRVVGEFLLARLPLFADKLNSLQVFQSALRDAYAWEGGAKRRKGCVPGALGPRVPRFEDLANVSLSGEQ